MAGESFLPSKGSISNRQFLTRLEQWGWKVKKIRGETTLIEAPHGKKVEVRSAHIRQGNPPKTFDEILSIMGMSWDDFIRPMEPEMQLAMEAYLRLDDEERRLIWEAAEVDQMTRMERVREQQRAQDLRLRDERRAAAKAERDRKRTNPQATPLDLHKPVFAEPQKPEEKDMAEKTPREKLPAIAAPEEAEVIPVPTEADNVAEEPEEGEVTLSHLKPGQVPSVKQVKSRVRSRGLTNRTLDVLVAANEPVSIERLTRLMPDARRDAIQQACLSLVRWNVAERMKPGVYRIREEARQNGGVRVDIVAHAATADDTPPAPAAPVRPVAPTTPEVPAHAPDVPRSADVEVRQPTYAKDRSGDLQMDEMVNDTLDLLFPQGFKAKHLPLIDQWRQATIALMREING